ncbi:MAG TPA: HAD family hydrolase [Burkholderiaceae bacterium]|jgi:FMN phosphatase YigB (HAD superfamily)|nr:HAD family hydrolase [Burkholderiaceae bacterium]
MNAPNEVVFLLDVDNTLLDNDRIVIDLGNHLAQEFGEANRQRYWTIFQALRMELGYVDYLGALQRYRAATVSDTRLLMLSSFLLDYPFSERVFPGVFELISHFRQWAEIVIVSDGDLVLQPRKIQKSGLWDAVEGHVLIYPHKERMLADIERQFPARHYVMVDDRVQILSTMKGEWGNRLTTVLPRPEYYATDSANAASYPMPDIMIEYVDDLIKVDIQTLIESYDTEDLSKEKHITLTSP